MLCLQGFQGYGYHPVFTKNLAQIHKTVFADPKNIFFEVVAGTDDICAPCQHRHGKLCTEYPQAEADVQRIDQNTLKILGKKVGDQDSAANFFALTHQKIKTKQDAKPICGKCQWQEKCLWYQGKA